MELLIMASVFKQHALVHMLDGTSRCTCGRWFPVGRTKLEQRAEHQGHIAEELEKRGLR